MDCGMKIWQGRDKVGNFRGFYCAGLFLLAFFQIVSGDAATLIDEEPSLGRLFTTPRQRVSLDLARRKALRKKQRSTKGSKQTIQQTVTLNGYVLRSNGPPAVWMNGRSALTPDGKLPPGVKLTSLGESHGVEVALTKSKRQKRVQLKTGQRMDGFSGKVLESYQGINLSFGRESGTSDTQSNSKRSSSSGKKTASKSPAKQKTSSGALFGEKALNEMISKREKFTEKIGFLNKILGN